ncbi:MAG: GAF domain-containing protein [Acidimicrobiia bacterium]
MDDQEIETQAAGILAEAADDEAALAAVVALVHGARPEWDWVGLYLLAGEELVLGPYVGEPTDHVRIPVGRGVCGTAVATGENQVVADVGELDNYLACSTSTRSEIVVLIRHEGEIVGQFDVDSDTPGAFGPDDEALLMGLAELAAARCATLARATAG